MFNELVDSSNHMKEKMAVASSCPIHISVNMSLFSNILYHVERDSTCMPLAMYPVTTKIIGCVKVSCDTVTSEQEKKSISATRCLVLDVCAKNGMNGCKISIRTCWIAHVYVMCGNTNPSSVHLINHPNV